MLPQIERYIKWVHENNRHEKKSNPDLVGKYELKKVLRFEKQIEKSKSPDYPYYFDEELAKNWVAFIEEFHLIGGKFEGVPLHLEDFQVFDTTNIVAWKKKGDRKRKHKYGSLWIAKGNGKTPLGAAFQIFDAISEIRGYSVSIATSRDQASISYNYVKEFINTHKELNGLFTFTGGKKTRAGRAVYDKKASIIEPLSSDSEDKHGKRLSMVLADEISSYKDSELFNAMLSSLKSEQPLVLMTSTASSIVDGVGYSEYLRGKDILDGKVENEEYFVSIYQLDEDDDWTNFNVYRKANPGLGTIVSEDSLRSDLARALDPMSNYESQFRTYRLNEWVFGSSSWIDSMTWTKDVRREEGVTEEELVQMQVAGGLDLSTIRDYSAYTLYFYDDVRKVYHSKHRFYIPEATVRQKMKTDSEKLGYWISKGWIVPTPGKTIDYKFIFEDIEKDTKRYPNFTRFQFDTGHGAQYVNNHFESHMKLEHIPFVWRSANYTSLLQDWQRDIINEKIRDCNDTMEWMVANTRVKTLSSGFLVLEKESDNKRIDGIVSSVLAHSLLKGFISHGEGFNADDVLDWMSKM